MQLRPGFKLRASVGDGGDAIRHITSGGHEYVLYDVIAPVLDDGSDDRFYDVTMQVIDSVWIPAEHGGDQEEAVETVDSDPPVGVVVPAVLSHDLQSLDADAIADHVIVAVAACLREAGITSSTFMATMDYTIREAIKGVLSDGV